MTRVTVALSGGVDSSIVAHRLIAEGHDVRGVTMRLLEPGASQAHESALEAAVAAARALDIPHTIIDLAEDFERLVLSRVAADYASGITPNPCVICNQRVKFGLLFDWACSEADLFATGHYVRTVATPEGWTLLRAADRSKDQSYFMYRLGQGVMERSIFPLGDTSKAEVVRQARSLRIPAAARAESQDVCFAAEGGLAAMVLRRHPEAERPGPIVDASGNVIGEHRGLVGYTVGQRKGLGIAAERPLHVLAIDATGNRLVVGPVEALDVLAVEASDVVWRGPVDRPVRCHVQTRYRGDAVPGTVTVSEGTLSASLDSPQSAVAPGQAVVCYAEDVCLGGGEIRSTHDRLPRSHETMRSRNG